MNSSAQVAYVVGHKRPDTDAVVSAVMGARFLARARGQREYHPLMQGPANPQTAWLFARAGLPLPPVRDDIRVTAGEACELPTVLHLDTPLGEAADQLRLQGASLLPVVDADGRWAGAIGTSFAESRFLFNFNIEDYLGQLLELADLPRGLRLTPLNAAARAPLAGARGSFVVDQHEVALAKGDVLLSAVPASAARAQAAGAAAVLLAGCEPGEAAAAASGLNIPAWHFAGSLMALVSQIGRAIPVGRVLTTGLAMVQPGDVLEDLLPMFLGVPHALPVVDATGRLLGLISRREALAPPRRALVLVDHFERSQSIRGVEACEILEIIDHHRIGALETIEPARVDCRPLGSTSTIIALRFAEAGLTPEPAEALLLLGAIIADTLALTSPTTTDADRRVSAELAARAGVGFAEFGREVLAQNDGLAAEPAPALVHRDLKEFERGAVRFLIGQIETVDLRLLTDRRRDELLAALEGARAQAGAAFALTMVTDVLTGVSRLLGTDPDKGRLRHLLEGEDGREGRTRDGLVSRKKQLLPLVLRRLGEWKS